MLKIMKKAILALLLAAIVPLMAQGQLNKKVGQVQIRDANDKPIPLPGLGEKTLLIFYVDPDKGSQNSKFTDYLEEHQIDSPNILSYGIVNLKDAPLLPNSIVRSIVRKKVAKTGAAIYTDPDHSLRDGWGLGNVNDYSVTIIVNKDQEIVFFFKGAMGQPEIDQFNKVIDQYK